MSKTRVCPICGKSDYKFVGYQWLPARTFAKFGWKVAKLDPSRPGLAAARFLVCRHCGNGHFDCGQDVPASPRNQVSTLNISNQKEEPTCNNISVQMALQPF